MGQICSFSRESPEPLPLLRPRKAKVAWQVQVHLAENITYNGEKRPRVSWDEADLNTLAESMAWHLLRVRGRRPLVYPLPVMTSASNPCLVPPPTVVALTVIEEAWLEPARIDDLLDDKGYALELFQKDIDAHRRLIPDFALVALHTPELELAQTVYPGLTKAMHRHGLPVVKLADYTT